METDTPTTNPVKPEPAPTQRYTHHVSVPSGEGIRVDKGITIDRPVAQVYDFWNRLENLPKFLRHVQSIEVRDDLHSHWAVRTVGEKIVEWDAEIIERKPNEMLSWRSLPGADVNNAGSVWFTPTPSGAATLVRISFLYTPAGGKATAFAAKLFGRDANAEIEEDLQRLKHLLETGRVPDEPKAVKWQRKAAEKTRRTAEQADQYIRNNPWVFILSVAGAGLLLGILMGRSKAKPRRTCLVLDADLDE